MVFTSIESNSCLTEILVWLFWIYEELFVYNEKIKDKNEATGRRLYFSVVKNKSKLSLVDCGVLLRLCFVYVHLTQLTEILREAID